MKLVAGVLTFEALRYDREGLLRQTLRSLLAGEPDGLFLIDNGSQDGSAALVEDLGGTSIGDPVRTCGHGMNVVMGLCAADADVVVFSNDDIAWHDGWAEKVKAFWDEAPDDILICSGSLEPVYPWNTPRSTVTAGGVSVLVRDTAPGGTWTFRARDWPVIGPVPEIAGWDDVPTCQRLRSMGYRVAQMDVATHEGEDHSTWGNESRQMATPLDRGRWAV